MKRIIDWYWTHSKNRPQEWTMLPSGLNTIMGAIQKEEAINTVETSSSSHKACIAFWGASQSGKSSFLSQYLDGDTPETSALTWSPDRQCVRFSGEQERLVDEAIIFNPYNGGMDASGLVTRFYLPEDEFEIDKNAPVEVILATRKQILHALAVGYRMECQVDGEWTLTDLASKLEMRAVGNGSRDAFELLYEVCDICENMASSWSEFREFARGTNLRQHILNSSYIESLSRAEELVAYILWNGNPRITETWKSLTKIQGMFDELLSDNDSQKKFFVSMGVAKELEDINVVNFYNQTVESPGSDLAKRRLKILDNLWLYKGEHGVVLSDRKSKPKAGKFKFNSYFGGLQALIGELRVPIRRTDNEQAKAFFKFLEHTDLLDLPGVTNKASGGALGRENQIDLSNCSDNDIYSRVYKSGKTLSIVHAQAEQCLIDSFVMFIDLAREGGNSRPVDLVNGIRAWLSPYRFTSFDKPLPLKLYVNFSLFGKLLDTVTASVQSGGLQEVCDKVNDLAFVSSPGVIPLFTSNRFKPCSNAQLKSLFENDVTFRSRFLSTEKGQASFDVLFSDGLGGDFLLETLRTEVSSEQRFSLYKTIRGDNLECVAQELRRLLPSTSEEQIHNRNIVVNRVLENIKRLMQNATIDITRKLNSVVKSIFVYAPEMLDEIPLMPHTKTNEELEAYLQTQICRWVTQQKEALFGREQLQDIVADADLYTLLEAIASIDIGAFVRILKEEFWNHNPNVSRGFLAMALNNAFLCGNAKRAPSKIAKECDYNKRLCLAFKARLEELSQLKEMTLNGRPMNLPGDIELFEIAQQLRIMG